MALERFTGEETLLQVAQVMPCTEAEGPGRRFAVWFQGCPLRCPGCCNPEMLSFQGGRPITTHDLVEQIRAAQTRDHIEGITLLGGEPLAHAHAAAILTAQARAMDLTVMVFSGYTLEEARNLTDPAVHSLLAQTDILVDGPYVRELPETSRRWIGSSNQRIHFFTNRHGPDDPCWRLPNTIEVRLTGKEITINGFPAPAAIGLWKKM